MAPLNFQQKITSILQWILQWQTKNKGQNKWYSILSCASMTLKNSRHLPYWCAQGFSEGNLINSLLQSVLPVWATFSVTSNHKRTDKDDKVTFPCRLSGISVRNGSVSDAGYCTWILWKMTWEEKQTAETGKCNCP